MFQSLFRRAEVAIEHTVGNVVTRVLIAVPFLIAMGFGTAALSLRLNREFDAETANLILAGLFALAGLVAAMIFAARSSTSKRESASSAAEAVPEQPDPAGGPKLSDTDRELVLAALTTAAPIALPQVTRLVMRNLPLLAAIGAAFFVMTRSAPEAQQMTPAE
jgi:hypothetical protein